MQRMTPGSRIYVAGHRGLVGSVLVCRLERAGFQDLILRTRSELDLCSQAEVRSFFEAERPEFVFLAAAKVGGIHANSAFPADFIYENLIVEANVIHESWRNEVKKVIKTSIWKISPKLIFIGLAICNILLSSSLLP